MAASEKISKKSFKIGQSNEIKQMSTQTDNIQRKSFPAEDTNVRSSGVNKSIKISVGH